MKLQNITKEQKRFYKQYGYIPSLENNQSNPQTKNSILCVRFGEKYGIEYVEKLRNMVDRHLSEPYEFVCLTDDPHNLPGVKNIFQPNSKYIRGWWHKIHMFNPELPLNENILYFDLDVVIHGNIDKLMNQINLGFFGIQDFNRKFHKNWKYLNSSVMGWKHGTQKKIWEDFCINPTEAMRLPGDQDFIWKVAKHKIKFWPVNWIQSYKWEVRSKEELHMVNGKRQFKESRHDIDIHPECCISVFHGDPKPDEVKDKFVIDNWR